MVDYIDSSYPINVGVTIPVVAEDFYNNYIKVDPFADFTITSAEPDKILIDTMQANRQSYIYRPNMGLDDFTMFMEIGVTQLDPRTDLAGWGGFYGIMFTKGATYLQMNSSSNTDGLLFYIRTFSSSPPINYFDVYIRQNFGAVGTNPNYMEWAGLIPWVTWPITTPATPRWLKVTRTGAGTVNDTVDFDIYNCDINTNPSCGTSLSGTNLHGLRLLDTVGTLNNFIPVNSHGGGLPLNMSGYCKRCVFL